MPPKAPPLKKVGLLNKSESTRKQNTPQQSTSNTAGQATSLQTKLNVQRKPSKVMLWSKRTVGVVGVLCLIALIIVPKPKLVTYRIAGVKVQNIYLPSSGNSQKGRLLDAAYTAYLNEERKEISLCSMYSHEKSNRACATYSFDSTGGVISAMYQLLTKPRL